MRIIKSGSKGLLKPKADTGDVTVNSEAQPKEIQATCTACLTDFAFTLLDQGVTLDNERDYNVECPECGTDLSIGHTTGIVTQL